MKLNDYLMSIAILIMLLSSLTLLFSINPSKKNGLIKSIPTTKTKYYENIMLNPDVRIWVEKLTRANGIVGDTPQAFFKECFKAILIAVFFLVVGIAFGYVSLGVGLSVFFLTYPILRRLMDRKEFKKQYLAQFYQFLNYLTLYVSGGIPIGKALLEVQLLMDIDEKSKDTEYFGQHLKEVVANIAVSGLSGNTYIEALKGLNEGLNFQEISMFVNAAKRSEKRGDAIADTLLNQLEDIRKKAEIGKRGHIAAQESRFETLKVIFCMVPALLMFATPIFVAAMLNLSVI